ncbi:LPXTG cell wall anchor domain-containing protein, partial [Enterococcus sp. LJL99]
EPTKEVAGDLEKDSSTWEATSRLLEEDGEHDLTLDFGFVKIPETPGQPEKTEESQKTEEPKKTNDNKNEEKEESILKNPEKEKIAKAKLPKTGEETITWGVFIGILIIGVVGLFYRIKRVKQ